MNLLPTSRGNLGTAVLLWALLTSSTLRFGSAADASESSGDVRVLQEATQKPTLAGSSGIADPCDAVDGEQMFLHPAGSLMYKPSYYTACIESLTMNTTQMIHHLENLDGIFREW
jgi:hypothetical protein